MKEKNKSKISKSEIFKSKTFKILIIIVLAVIVFILAAWLNDIKNSKGFGQYTYNPNLDVSDDLQQIIYYGTLAQNSHNVQMWKVKIISDNTNQKQITIMQDKTRLLSNINPSNHETMICIGAFISNIEQAAKCLGYDYSTKIIADDYFDDNIADITLAKTDQKVDKSLFKIMKLTDANRKYYMQDDIKKQDIEYITSVDSTHISYFDKDSQKGKYIANAIVDATKKFETMDSMLKEQQKWTRFSNEQAFNDKDGLTPEMLAQPLIMRQFLYTLSSTKIMESDAFKKSTISATENQVKNSAGFFVITSDTNSVEDLVNVGRNLQLFWFNATQKNISMHPLTIMLLLSPYKDEVETNLDIKNKQVNMILRAGYVKKIPYPVSLRRNIDQIIVK